MIALSTDWLITNKVIKQFCLCQCQIKIGYSIRKTITSCLIIIFCQVLIMSISLEDLSTSPKNPVRKDCPCHISTELTARLVPKRWYTCSILFFTPVSVVEGSQIKLMYSIPDGTEECIGCTPCAALETRYNLAVVLRATWRENQVALR